VLAHIVHMALVPFMGSEAANEFIEGKLAESPAAAGPGGTSRRRRSRKSS
jgi:hypothetical protein